MPSLTLKVLAERVGGRLFGDPALVINGVAELSEAGPGELAPCWDEARAPEFPACRACALLVTQERSGLKQAQLICADPRRALGMLLDIFSEVNPGARRGTDPRAAVDSTARVDASAWIGPFTYIGPGAVIGPRAQIEPFSYVGPSVTVGADSRVGPGATLLEGCETGERVVLGPGCVVGYEGFGFWRDEEGWHRIGSRGRVVLGDEVELGAGSCVDRGTLGATRIGAGAKIDNLVQVAHNARVGERALLCAQVGLAGSATVGEECVLGGQVGVADHLTVGAGARVGAHSGVARDVPPAAVVTGYPALGHQRWLRSSVLLSRIPELFSRVRELGNQIERLRRDPGPRDTKADGSSIDGPVGNR